MRTLEAMPCRSVPSPTRRLVLLALCTSGALTTLRMHGDALPGQLPGRATGPLASSEKPFPQDRFLECVRVIHTFEGESGGDFFGWVSAEIPDVDGDGVHEVFLSAPFHDAGGLDSGRVYLYSGRTGVELFRADGQAGEGLGNALRDAGDLNRDGVCDVIAGGTGSAGIAGVASVYSGTDGAPLLTLRSGFVGDSFGDSVASAGDFDADGTPDYAVGASTDDSARPDAGRVYIFSGATGAVLWTIEGTANDDRLGTAVENMGDINGDGRPELAIGADQGFTGRGKMWVYDLAQRAILYVKRPSGTGKVYGRSFVFSPGDVNGDNRPDIFASDFADGNGNGKTYVYDGPSGNLLWSRRGAPGDGFGVGHGAGDVNGDGFDDLLLASFANSDGAPGAGKAELFSGLDGSLLQTITSTSPGEAFGFGASGMGDVDGDGHRDFLVTAATRAGSRGRAYLIAGGPPVETYGVGLAGSGGCVPEIASNACPRVGGALQLTTSRVRSGARGLLLLGRSPQAVPVAGGTLYTQPGVFRRAHSAGPPTGVACAGEAAIWLAIPSDPALVGEMFYAQAAYWDPGALRGVSFTSGLSLRIH